MDIEHQTRINSSELASLWSSYQNNTMAICVLNYFLANVEDSEIKSVLEFALGISVKSVNIVKDILKKNNQPIPIGFSEEDVSSNAPRLYSDAYYLYYLKHMSKIGLSVYGIALTTCAHSDVRDYFNKAIQLSSELYNKTAEVLLSKGLYVRAPYVTTKDNVEFVESQNYLGGLLNFNPRPLNVLEITHISENVETNIIGQTLLTGFAQVAKNKNVRKYCFRGKDIAKKHVELFFSLLIQDDLPSPIAWDLEVSNSTIAPFSDKLIMFHTTALIGSGLSNYATATAASLRMDIGATYSRLAVEIGEYAVDGTKLMIDNQWLEQPPQIADRKKISNI